MNTFDAISLHVNAAANFDYVVTRGYKVVDIVATTNGSVGGGATATPQRSTVQTPSVFNALGAALAVGVTNEIVYAGTVIDAQATFSAGDTLRVVGSSGAMNADLFVTVIPTSWIAG